MKQVFEVVTWPDSQALMDYRGWDSNSYLINDDKGLEVFGSSAYFVDSAWLNKVTQLADAVQD